MASAASLQLSISIRNSTKNDRLFPGFSHYRPTFALPLSSHPRPILVYARRRPNRNGSVPSSKKKKQSLSSKDVKESDLDDDPFEALFQQLAEDLKNDDGTLDDDDDEEITDKELAELERELDKVLDDGEFMGLSDSLEDNRTKKTGKGKKVKSKKVKGKVKEAVEELGEVTDIEPVKNDKLAEDLKNDDGTLDDDDDEKKTGKGKKVKSKKVKGKVKEAVEELGEVTDIELVKNDKLAEDLKNDDGTLDDDDDEEITDKELAELDRELDKVLDDGEFMGLFDSLQDNRTKKKGKGKKINGKVKEAVEELGEVIEDLAELEKIEEELQEVIEDLEAETESEEGIEGEEDDVEEGELEDDVEEGELEDDVEEGELEEDVEEGELEEDEDDDSPSSEEEEEEEEEDESEEDEDDDFGEEEETQVELRRWQLKRLAYALKTGRRKANVKSLSADLCLDRAVVLQLLRDPPPDLLMLSATLPDEEPEQTILAPEIEIITPVKRVSKKVEAKKEVPIHVLRRGWSTQKRIKKVHVETLERVYRKTKRPTGAMVSNIVHVTSLPRRTVVKWFEDKRNKDGVPDRRRPYERYASEPGIFTSS